MMKYLLPTLMTLSALTFVQVAAEPATACSQINDAQERLACFDRQFPGESESPVQQSSTPSQPANTITDLVKEKKKPTAAGKINAMPGSTPKQKDTGFRGGMLSNTEALDMSSRIKSIRKRNKQKMVFMLENEQVWLQSTPRPLPIRTGEAITIKSARMGGYILRTENGTSTRVRRIK